METKPKSSIVQRLKKSVKDDIALAEKYYRILSAVNDLKLTNREVQLIAFAAINIGFTFFLFLLLFLSFSFLVVNKAYLFKTVFFKGSVIKMGDE